MKALTAGVGFRDNSRMRFWTILLLAVSSLSLLAGKELDGTYLPSQDTCPSPEAAAQLMTVPDGYAVRCFAHEPMVMNPVAMTWDHRGRLWVVEAYEYPLGSTLPAPFGGEAKEDQYHPMPVLGKEFPRDRVVILEDTDNDGTADKRTVFVEGLNLASAILCGDDGIYIGQQPHLLHFRDEDGDDKPDAWRVVLTGFGREDTHELVNSFCWGPDGWLYMTHGVFTHSKVRRPGQPESEGFKFDAGIGRCRPVAQASSLKSGVAGILPADAAGKIPATPGTGGAPVLPWEFEVFADGTSNPWGCDYDAAGNFFVSACVIDHFFHMAPGGIYVRQGGAPENPYSYELLPSIVTHKHLRAAYAGVQIYQGGVYPQDTWGHAFIGNIHDNAIHEEVLTPVGSTFKCEPRRDFLRANNGWFRPVSTQTGPDGNLWVMDWCDKYPCYQNAKANPEGVDRGRGRIWRVVVDAEKSLGSRDLGDLDLKKLPTAALVKTLEHPNNWMRRMARRMLVERRPAKGIEGEAVIGLTHLWRDAGSATTRTEAMWTLGSANYFGAIQTSTNPLVTDSSDELAPIRAWCARWIGENPHRPILFSDPKTIEALTKLASDSDPIVRYSVAVALRQSSESRLTVDRGTFKPWSASAWQVLAALLKNDDKDSPRYAFAVWQALEPQISSNPAGSIEWLSGIAPTTQPLSLVLSHKAMRRVCDTREAKNLDLAVAFCDKIAAQDVLLANALSGLVKGQEGGIIKPTKDVSASVAAWRTSKNDDVRRSAQQLAVLWGDPVAIGELVAVLLDSSKPDAERIAALQSLRQVKTDAAKAGYAKLVSASVTSSIGEEVIRAAADLGGDETPGALLKVVQTAAFPHLRLAAFEALASRETWALAMLDAIAAGKVSAAGFPITVRRQLAASPNQALRNQAEAALGTWKDSSADTKKLIAEKRAACLDGEPDLANGKLLFTGTCAVCHTFHGGGQKVGPELIGSGRSNLDALLSNVIDPNQIIGNGYENFILTTKDGRTLSGRVVEDTPSHVQLLAAGGTAQIVSRDEIAKLDNTHQSLMPMGFGQLPDGAFRDLIWYVLAPPEEGPLTAEKKKLLSTSIDAAPAKPAAAKTNWRAIDWESVSLWNPAWKVNAPDFERTPLKLADYYGKPNVLLLHPFPDKKTPASFERKIKVSPGKTKLHFSVAADDRGDWELRVVVDAQVVKTQQIDHEKPRWKDLEIDLTPWNGKEVTVRLESHATGWAWEFAYWQGITLQ